MTESEEVGLKKATKQIDRLVEKVAPPRRLVLLPIVYSLPYPCSCASGKRVSVLVTL